MKVYIVFDTNSDNPFFIAGVKLCKRKAEELAKSIDPEHFGVEGVAQSVQIVEQNADNFRPLTAKEQKLINLLDPAAEIQSGGNREFDIIICGRKNGVGYSAWLPLKVINEKTDWTKLVEEPDWSFVRDATPEQIWEWFHASDFVKAL